MDYEKAVREWYEVGVRGQNREMLFGKLSPRIQWWCFGPPGFKSNGYYEGHEGVINFFANLAETLQVDMSKDFVPTEFHVAGHVVTVFGRETGMVKQKGVPEEGRAFHNYFAHTLYFEGDKIIRFRVNYTVVPPNSMKSPLDA